MQISLKHLKIIVLDEADKLFEAGKGFLEQMDAVFSACSQCKGLVRCLFSATLPEWVEHVAGSVLQEPTSIIIGAKNSAARSVKQSLQFVGKVWSPTAPQMLPTDTNVSSCSIHNESAKL